MRYDNIKRVWLYISTASKNSLKAVEVIKRSGVSVTVVRLDTPTIRRQFMMHPTHPVKVVPSIGVLYNDDTFQIFSSLSKIVMWLDEFTSSSSGGSSTTSTSSTTTSIGGGGEETEIIEEDISLQSVPLDDIEIIDAPQSPPEIPPPPPTDKLTFSHTPQQANMMSTMQKAQQLASFAQKLTPGLSKD